MTHHATVPPPVERPPTIPLLLAAVYRSAARLLTQAGHRQTFMDTACARPRRGR
ncbi:hypothetical protein [Streptomyces aureocirculatus]|uniref:hypothetical protein n=1 Tax=Streptomyces aureocirculatus TaxID=67275 RepID=UPI000A6776BC|nr:hypothetical protein [Streptomyces aureocirculatus]